MDPPPLFIVLRRASSIKAHGVENWKADMTPEQALDQLDGCIAKYDLLRRKSEAMAQGETMKPIEIRKGSG